MKELKFRVWNKKQNRYNAQKDAPVVLYDTGETAVRYGNPCNGDVELLYTDNYEIELYTGLKDKNGKEIYEGDIIDFFGEKYPVIYRAGCFWAEYSKTQKDHLFLYATDSEVIGNIHENPELVKEEK